MKSGFTPKRTTTEKKISRGRSAVVVIVPSLF